MNGFTRVVDYRQSLVVHTHENDLTHLIIRCTEATTEIFVIKNSNFKCKVFLQVLNDHDQKRQLDAQSLFWIGRTGDVVG